MMDDYLPPYHYTDTSPPIPPEAISIDDILDMIESAKYYAIRLPVKICNVVCNVKLSDRVDLATLGAKAPDSKVLKNMVLVRCTNQKFPFTIPLLSFAAKYKGAKYEPELQCAVVYKIGDPKATFMIYSTGTVNVFATSMYNVYVAFRRISPLLCEIADDNFRRIKFDVGIFESK